MSVIKDILYRSRWKIASISAISALAGFGNIWLIALLNANVQARVVGNAQLYEYVGILLAVVVAGFIAQVLLSRLGARTFHGLRNALVDGISQLSAKDMEAIGRARLLTALTRDVPAVHELIVVLPTYVFNAAVVVACLGYLGVMSLPLLGMLVGFLVVALAVAKLAIADRAEHRFAKRRAVEDELFRSYEALIEGHKELRLHRSRAAMFRRDEVDVHAERYRDATLAAEFFWNLSNTWSTAAIFLAMGGLAFASMRMGIVEPARLQVFMMVIFYLVAPLTILMNSFRTLHGAKVGLDRLGRLQLESRVIDDIIGGEHHRFESLSLDAVTFTYAGDSDGAESFSVGPIDFSLRRGEIVFFVGGNGSGKTTVAKVLTGIFEHGAGSIRLNGRHVDDRDAYMQTFSAVFQDYYLFDRVLPKVGNVPDTVIREMIDRLKLNGKVDVKEGRLTTTRLSYGQRKRLALLVCQFDASDVLVFDEWAADQDPAFRDFFYRELLPDLRRAGKSVVAISHDDRYFDAADRVVRFESGRILESDENSREDLLQAHWSVA